MLSRSSGDPLTGDLDSISLLHDVMKFIPYNRRTLCAMRCVSKPYRRAVQHPGGPWASHKEIILSRHGQCIIFNAKDDEEGRSNFELSSVSPIGRKFGTSGATLLNRYHQRVADGLTRLVLHHSKITVEFFEALGPLTNLKSLELASCRNITSIVEASRVSNLESLEVYLCPLEADGVVGLCLPKLKRLKLHSCFQLQYLNGIAEQTAAALEEVYIENCKVYDDTTNIFFMNLTDKLRVLHLPGTHLDTALTFIPESVRKTGLTSLYLGETPLRFETLSELASSMQERLEFLSLVSCRELESFEPLGRLEQLRFLDVSASSHGEGLHFLSSCSKLERFCMAYCNIENIMFLSTLQALQILEAPFSDLTDMSLMFLEHLPMLETVVLTGCASITNVNVLGSCKRIRRIFCAYTAVTNEGIALLTDCPELEELDLKSSSVTDVNILLDCPSLKYINVYDAVRSKEGLELLLKKKGLEVTCNNI